MMRRETHLTAEEITAWRDGGRADAPLNVHLLTCDLCRMRLAEALVMRHLLRSSQGTPAAGHLAAREIGHYLDAILFGEAMPEERRRAIEEHLDTCAACLKQLLDLRAGLMPPEALRARILRQLGTEEASTGRLTVRIWAFVDRLVMEVLEMEVLEPDALSSADAMSAILVPKPSRDEWVGALRWLLDEKKMSSAKRLPGPKTKRPGTLRAHKRLSWSGSDVDLACVVEKGRARLDVTVTEHGSGGRRAGTPLSMSGRTSGSLSASTTDRHGRARLLLPPEPVVLTIGTTPPLELEIDFRQFAFGWPSLPTRGV